MDAVVHRGSAAGCPAAPWPAVAASRQRAAFREAAESKVMEQQDCMETLAINLGIIFVVQIIVTNIVTYYIPYLRRVANFRETQLLFPNNEFSEQELQSFFGKLSSHVSWPQNKIPPCFER